MVAFSTILIEFVLRPNYLVAEIWELIKWLW